MTLGEAFDATLYSAATGDPEAARLLWTDLAPVVHGYLRGQGCVDAEDVTSETFLDVFRGLDRFDGDETGFRSWVFTIAHRRLVDSRRRASRRPSTTVDEIAAVPDEPVPTACDLELSPALATWLEELPPLQREVTLLREVAGLPVAEVATVLGRREGAVRSAHHRALTRLRERGEDARLAHIKSRSVTSNNSPSITGS